jgi:hypothetical protein
MARDDEPAEQSSAKGLPQYHDAGERKIARREIDAIANDLDLPAEEIAAMYAQLYDDLKARAKVTDYLRVFVSRKIRARYPSARRGTPS